MKLKFARIFLGGLFVWSSLDKIAHPAEFAAVINGYQILPGGVISFTALCVPWIEFSAGLLTMLGLLTEAAIIILGTLAGIFSLATLSALVRGLHIQCGCFSGHGLVSWLSPLIDLSLAWLAFYILRHHQAQE